ncbi:hypothetical protein [Enterobacter ludwigii]|uniref:hypothetical protein n=1 Tax=Enterobacter ludwigii TaxID=299767 RepID=UPI003974E920
MKKNTGECKNKKCKKPISEYGEANKNRYCEEHYQLSVEKNKKNLQKRISKIADRTISIKKLRKIEDLISDGKIKEEIERKKINKKWTSESIKRKSDVNDILKSREWKNTQELIRRRNVFCNKKEFMIYVQNVFQLYSLKLLFSREYLNKDNTYKKHVETPLVNFIPVITIKLEVAFTFNIQSSVSMSSDDVILVPERIRKMITLKKALLNKKRGGYVPKDLNDKSSKRKAKEFKLKKSKIKKKSNSIYQQIKRENSLEDVISFMDSIRANLKHEHRNIFNTFPPFFNNPIEKSLPFFHLAQSQYVRIFKEDAEDVFISLEKELSTFGIYLEAYGLLSSHELMSGRAIGNDLINKTRQWIENEQKEKSDLYNIMVNIQTEFEVVFKIKISDRCIFSKMYNSYFSEDIVQVSPITGEIEAIRKNNNTN